MIPDLLLSFLAGLVLGTLFFGGLWLTVRRLPTSSSPALLALGSLLLRMALLAAGLYLISRGSWQQLGVTLLGILIARTQLTRNLGAVESSSHEGSV